MIGSALFYLITQLVNLFQFSLFGLILMPHGPFVESGLMILFRGHHFSFPFVEVFLINTLFFQDTQNVYTATGQRFVEHHNIRTGGNLHHNTIVSVDKKQPFSTMFADMVNSSFNPDRLINIVGGFDIKCGHCQHNSVCC